MKKSLTISTLPLLAVLTLNGCGGGSSTSLEDTADTANTKTAYLVDKRVAGVTVSNGIEQSTTDSNGAFTCKLGETITFSVGGVTLGSMVCDEIEEDNMVYVSKLLGISRGNIEANLNNPNLILLLRFLQSLDEDNDLSNGITINQETAQALADAGLDFTTGITEQQLLSLFTTLGKTLISSENALKHFRATLIEAAISDGTVQDFIIDEDTIYSGTLNDSESNETYSIVLNPNNGSLTLSSNGSFTYTPSLNYNGSDFFTYKIDDNDPQRVNITITPINDAPLGTLSSISTDEDTPYSGILTATDVDSTTFTFTITSTPSNGTLTGFNTTTGSFTYTPNSGFSGDDTISYKVNDGELDSIEKEVSVTVNSTATPTPTTPSNNAPVINTNFSNVTMDENNGTTNYQLSVSDADSDDLNITVESNNTSIITVSPSWTNLVDSGTYATALDFNLSTVNNANGMVNITVTVSDGSDTDTSSFNVTVNDVMVLNGLTYKSTTSPYTGRVWLDRNLGATQVCTSSTDSLCYGDYYQWGRNTDGHESNATGNLVTSTTQESNITNTTPNTFIIGSND